MSCTSETNSWKLLEVLHSEGKSHVAYCDGGKHIDFRMAEPCEQRGQQENSERLADNSFQQSGRIQEDEDKVSRRENLRLFPSTTQALCVSVFTCIF